MKQRTTHYMLKEDEKGKEPNIYFFLLFTAVMAAVFAFLLYTDAGAAKLGACYIVFLSLMVVMLLAAGLKQHRVNPYSYNIIYYRGFALFFLILLFSCIRYCIGIFRLPDAFSSYDIIWFIADSAITYLFTSLGIVLIVSAWLCVSNIALIRHEGKRLVNVLGIILAFLMSGGLLLLIYISSRPFTVPPKYQMAVHLALNLCAVLYLYLESMLIGSFLAVFLAAHYEPDPDKDFVIVLGCRIRKDGSPTPLLRGRIERAVGFCEKQKEATGRAPLIITSGGKGPDEVISESASMKQYLLEQGIDEGQIVEEDQSVNTWQNMVFSKEKIQKIKPDAKVAYATTNYHVFRSGLYARRAGLRAVGMGQPTKWWFWANATVRECVGLMKDNMKLQAWILGSFAAVCTAITILSFH